MKNLLIVALVIGLTVSLYFNWKWRKTSFVRHNENIELGKDSFNLTLFFEDGMDTTGKIRRGAKAETLDTVMFTVSSRLNKSGSTEWELCCPTPPIDTSADFTKNYFRLRLLPKVKIYKNVSK